MSRNGNLLSFLNTYARGYCTELIEKEGFRYRHINLISWRLSFQDGRIIWKKRILVILRNVNRGMSNCAGEHYGC